MSGKVTARIELPKLTNAIDDATAETMTQMAADTLELIRNEIWKGFKYGPYYPEEQRGTSGNAWRINHLAPGESGFEHGFVLYNDAAIQPRVGTKKNGDPYSNNSVGEFYAGYVQKSGESKPLWMTVVHRIKTDLVPDFETELIINTLNATANNVERVDLRADDESIGTYDFEL